MKYTNGLAVDITLRIGLPQLELGAFATSPILTTAAAATRLASVGQDTAISTWYNAVESSFVVGFRANAVTGTRPIISLDDNTANEQIRLYLSGTSLKLTITDGGVTQADLTLGTVAAGTDYTAAFAVTANDFRAIVTGGSVQSDVSGTMPTVTRIRYGSDQAGNYGNLTLADVTCYRKALPSATLQSLAV
jgi:hypothetical protein